MRQNRTTSQNMENIMDQARLIEEIVRLSANVPVEQACESLIKAAIKAGLPLEDLEVACHELEFE